MLRSHALIKETRAARILALAQCVVWFAWSGTQIYGGQELKHSFWPAVQASTASDPPAEDFRAARELVAAREYAKAEAKFAELIRTYPESKTIDVALFWLAFALKKQEKYQEAEQALQMLIDQHPNSTWLKDAREMRVELAVHLGRRDIINEGVSQADDDIKVVALQSLFETERERALQFLTDILGPESKASTGLKERAIIMLAEKGGEQAKPLLINVLRNEQDQKLRIKAIQALREHRDETVANLLKNVALDSDEVEIGKAAVKSLLGRQVPRQYLGRIARSAKLLEVRQEAIIQMAYNYPHYGLEELPQIYVTEQNIAIRSFIVAVLAKMGSHTNEVIESRATTMLCRMYDQEENRELKGKIIAAIGRSTQKTGIQKLINVAKNDPVLTLRKQAVECLSKSDNPEAATFVRELREVKQF